jgi:prepilin-type N-terminal cleavage/methylation domain-containing protein
MRRSSNLAGQSGFTIVELLVALGIFLLVCGAAFSLLGSSQQRYRADSQLLTSFQEARLGLDQIVRDVNDSGYPPPTFAGTNSSLFTSTPFAWSPGYTVPTVCNIVINCISPADFDLIVETNPNPNPTDPNNVGVQWIRYVLQGSTLMRTVANKLPSTDPAVQTSANLAPFVQNVVNNASAAQIALYQASYPGMFPTGPVPIFTYICDTPTAPQPPPTLCSAAGPDNSPKNIREVIVTLIVAAPLPDANTGAPRLVQLEGRGRRVNPNH